MSTDTTPTQPDHEDGGLGHLQFMSEFIKIPVADESSSVSVRIGNRYLPVTGVEAAEEGGGYECVAVVVDEDNTLTTQLTALREELAQMRRNWEAARAANETALGTIATLRGQVDALVRGCTELAHQRDEAQRRLAITAPREERAQIIQAAGEPGEELLDLTLEEKAALPAHFHTPVWSETTPGAFVCRVCWTEGVMTGWPCETAQANGAHVFAG